MNPQPIDLPYWSFQFWIDLALFLPVLVVLAVSIYFWRQGTTGFGFIKKQSDFLDNQTDVSRKALEQSKTFEDMIAAQYQATNERSDKALAQSEEAIRLHAAALAELARINESLSRLTEAMAAGKGTASSGTA